MGKNDQYTEEDRAIKEFFESFSPSAPSDEFTKRTMNIVMQEWVNKPQVQSIHMRVKNKLWWVVSTVFAFLLIYFFDVKRMGGQESMFGLVELKESFVRLFSSFWLEFDRVPSLVYLVIIGLVVLLIIDKMISRVVKS